MRIQFAIICALGVLCCSAQSPGGVEGFSNWYMPKQTDDAIIVQDMGSDMTLLSLDELRYGNDNPMISSDSDLWLTSLEMDHVPKTIFTIGQSDRESEQILWHLEVADAVDYILTNYRMADLSSDSYIDIDQRQPGQLFMITYVLEQTADMETASARLRLGNTTRSDIPADTWQGALGDVICFDRILTFDEQCRVESMLAIKYGIHKSSFRSPHYLNAKGDIIWDGIQLHSYANDIAGIGRDDRSGLLQIKSTSTQDNLPLTISINDEKENLMNESFLLWGHDGKTFNVLDDSEEIIPVQRKYLVQLSNWNVNLSTQIQLDLRNHPLYLSPDEKLWLRIDATAKGDFNPGNTSFYSGKSNGHDIYFENIVWDLDSSGQDGFAFFIAPDNFIYAQVEAGICSSPTKSTLHWKLVGAKGDLSITGPAGFHVQLTGETAVQGSLALPDHGMYTLTLAGIEGEYIIKHIWTSSSQVPEFNLPRLIELKDDDDYLLDLSAYDMTEYVLLHPDGNRHGGPVLYIKEAGTYYLIFKQDECEFIQTILVSKNNSQDGIDCLVFPNPIADGHYQVSIDLKSQKSINIELFNPSGQLVFKQDYHGRSQYFIENKINGPSGKYVLNVFTDTAIYSEKLIVLRK